MSAVVVDFEVARTAKQKRDRESYLRRKAAGTLWKRKSTAAYRLRTYKNRFDFVEVKCDDCKKFVPTKFFPGENRVSPKCLCLVCAIISKAEKG